VEDSCQHTEMALLILCVCGSVIHGEIDGTETRDRRVNGNVSLKVPMKRVCVCACVRSRDSYADSTKIIGESHPYCPKGTARDRGAIGCV